MTNTKIIPETADHLLAIGELHRRAFGQPAEAELVAALRKEGLVRVSLVAVDETSRVVGHLLMSRITIEAEDQSRETLSLAPMAVLPELQRQGIGTMMLTEAIVQCRELDEQSILVLGHPAYYSRFGFSADLAATLQAPWEVPREAWMALELTPDALPKAQGKVIFSPPFAEL